MSKKKESDMKINNNFWLGKRVFITGHNGFKGSWLTLWLLQLGAEISGYSLEQESDICLFNQLNLSSSCHNNINDIRDKDTLEKKILDFAPDMVFHLAAQPLVGLSYEKPESTWSINLMGTIYLLESLRKLKKKCVAVVITTDKVYQNNEWDFSYKESDKLGGDDPYSGSKAAVEIAVNSWRKSFCGSFSHQTEFLKIATARAGNVIGGGDWLKSRIIPDLIYGLSAKKEVLIRNSLSTRPWQHVLEPLSGYLLLAKSIYSQDQKKDLETSFNFGPNLESNKNVRTLIQECSKYWSGEIRENHQSNAPHEAGKLNVSIDKAFHKLNWYPRWDFETSVKKTISWYRYILLENKEPLRCCLNDISDFEKVKN